jgi:glycosyltransferase involved in cell wall biosynthesis
MTRYYPVALIDNSRRNFLQKKATFTQVNKLTLVAPSDWLRDHVRESFFKGTDCLTINNGIDLETFQPRKAKSPIPTAIGVASTWSESKGLGDFVELRKLLPESYRIVLIGLTPRQIRQLPRGITAFSKTDSARDLAEWYSQASVFVNPTYGDTFPTVNLEALACGTPVITYKTGGSPEAISPETGESVPTGDVKQLASTITRWVESNSPQRFQACKDRAEQRYSDRARFEEYVQLYHRLLQ